MFDRVFQLTDIALPVVGHQQRKRFSRDSRNACLSNAVEAGYELVHQKRDVLLSTPQGREFDAHNVQTIVKVFPELAFPHPFCQIPIGRSDDADIGL